MFKMLKALFRPAEPNPAPPMTSETMMGFQNDEVAPFLTRLANNPRFDMPAELDTSLTAGIAGLDVGESRRWSIDGRFDGQFETFAIEAAIETPDQLELTFYGAQAAIMEIEQELTLFDEATGPDS